MMMEFGEFAKVLKRGTEQLHGWLAMDLWTIGGHQQVIAAHLIGHELPQWPALAESTVREKERLGYVGQVSATDPLLRTGANRDSIKVAVEPETLTEVTGSDRLEFLWMEMGFVHTSGESVPPRPSLAIAAVDSLPFAADVLKETAYRALTGMEVKYALRDFNRVPKP